jgi:hypothetical protein
MYCEMTCRGMLKIPKISQINHHFNKIALEVSKNHTILISKLDVFNKECDI